MPGTCLCPSDKKVSVTASLLSESSQSGEKGGHLNTAERIMVHVQRARVPPRRGSGGLRREGQVQKMNLDSGRKPHVIHYVDSVFVSGRINLSLGCLFHVLRDVSETLSSSRSL